MCYTTLMNGNPLAYVDWRDWVDWIFVIMFILTPIVTLGLLVSVVGIFIIPFWWGYLSEWKPSRADYVQARQKAARRHSPQTP